MKPTLIITRPEPAGSRFSSRVIAAVGQFIPTIFSPAFEIQPLDVTVPPAEHVIFTSRNGVASAIRLGVSRETTAWCVGDQTAVAARDAGFDAISAGRDAEALLALIMTNAPEGRIIHLAGRHTRGAIAARLAKSGYPCDYLAAYDQVSLPPTTELLRAMAGNGPLVSPVFSPRSAAPLGVNDKSAPLHCIAISGAVAEHLTAMSADTVITSIRPDEDAMVEATSRVIMRLFAVG